MKQELAEGVLAQVMGWDAARLAQELPELDRMARFKYDEYQQFAPGRKFLENLVLWLHQFQTVSEREAAYAFTKDRLVFISTAEMRHLVEATYPDIIRPILIRRAAEILGQPSYRLGQIVTSPEYAQVQRSSLFLGLSDGSRMDVFRRAAGLDNEQVWQAYELGSTKSAGMLKDLRERIGKGAFFQRIFLLDDFSASGISYIRLEGTDWKGKVSSAIRQFDPGGDACDLVGSDGYEMYIVLYVATRGAVEWIQAKAAELFSSRTGAVPKVLAVYQLPDATPLRDDCEADKPFLALVEDDRYYRKRALDRHEAKGRTRDVKRGFAGCALPVILAHNTPNNSVYLLWGRPEQPSDGQGLFPRLVRHKEPG
jgi:hypothetical protein